MKWMTIASTKRNAKSPTSALRGSNSSHIRYMMGSSSADQRQRAVSRAHRAVEHRVSLGPGNPRPPHPDEDVRDDCDDGEYNEACDEQGVELLRLRFSQS